MTFEEIQENVREWADAKGLIQDAQWDGAKAQFAKLEEEIEELINAINWRSEIDAVDAIGDCMVVLTNIALNLGTTPLACYEHAWHQIKDRTGKTVNGVFVKDGQS